jgi:hypothetical protein
MLKTQIHCKQFKSSTLCNGKGTDMQWDRSECLCSQMNLLIPHRCKVHRTQRPEK